MARSNVTVRGSAASSVTDLADGIAFTISGSAGGWWSATVTDQLRDGSDSLGVQALAGQTNTHGSFIDELAAALTAAPGRGARLALGDDSVIDRVLYTEGYGVDVITQSRAADVLRMEVVNGGARSTQQVMSEGVPSTFITDGAADSGVVLKGVASIMAGDVLFV